MKKLYIVYVHITPDGMHYYGVTNNHKHRWGSDGIHYRDTSLHTYIEKYGWDNIQHVVLYENLTYEDALKIEDSLIISGWEKGNCINKRRSGNVSKDDIYIREYQREYQRDYQRDYYKKNKDKIREYQREYQRENKDKIKQYREKSKDKINEQSRQRYHENLSKSREKNRIKNQKYRQRKKEEKQFRELGYVPLF